ncbi:hypothetical protein Cantr_00275 [Candida viswanathii]|uniref:25S rRNA (uridine-N(3))-methyltransferase BMT5-like domain-containing protein n=1 Tax=Candida viswanathii TaxID=5486 RepID=A0A367YFD4_9ASCO|nr:hypothetical protein Cantr_00275 [Candida viswanathii]
MARKLKGKSIQSKGLKGALARHQTREQTQAKLAQNAEISSQNKLNKIKSMKTSKKQKQQNKLHQATSRGRSKGLMPFNGHERVLLIGEGDFSFARSLILQNFLIPENLIATSFDTHETLLEKYPDVEETLTELAELGVRVMHGVDATNLPVTLKLTMNSRQKKQNKKVKLFENGESLDYVMFNFPHTGRGIKDQDRNIRDHQNLILLFFKNCKLVFELVNSEDLLGYKKTMGKIIISLFEGEPYHSWGIKILGKSEGYKVERSGRFEWGMFPEYHHRRTNSTKNTTKPAAERDARIYIFDEWVKQEESTKEDNDSD